jgi:hypothetical protein
MIKINRERYLKHTVTNLETPNEPSFTDFPILGNYSCDSYFGNFTPLLSNVPFTQNFKLIFQDKSPTLTGDTFFYQNSTLELVKWEVREQENNKGNKNSDPHSQIWTLYFDGSKSQEGFGGGCILINPICKHYFMYCRLEFECTNNIFEYEALVQGLKKAIDLDIKGLKVFGDSEIIVRKIINTIHFNSRHLKNY